MRLPHFFLCIQGVIKISNERKSQIFYQGNGTQTQYQFPFDYLRRAFVKVRLISSDSTTDLTQGTDYNVSDRVVTLTNPTSLKIQIYRETTTKPLVGWADASVLRAADMTVQSTQLLHLSEETMDKVQDGGLAQDTNDGVWDARYNRIKNLLDPKDPGDAVTLSYIVANQTSLINALKATGKEQNDSIVSTGNTQNTRLTTTGDTQNKRLTDTGDSYVSTMTTLKDTATTKATEASDSAELSKKWAMSSTSPDGATDSKSSKTWAESAKVSAGNAAASASASKSSANASASSATNSANSANSSKQSASASANSASAAASSASAASTSATNAKTSETTAAKSATAAAQSAEIAKTWDPTNYTKTLKIKKVDNSGNNVLIILQEVPDYYTYNSHRCGGSFAIYPYVRAGQNGNFGFPPVCCSVSLPYNTSTSAGLELWSTHHNFVPLVVKNNTTNKIYWGISVRGSDSYALIFGAFEHDISIVDTLLSADHTDTYEGYTVLKTAIVKTIATTSDLPTKTSQLTNDSDFANAAALEAEAKKWKDAYNNLRKRSYPTQFDDDELTVLMGTPIGGGAITLSQPYTDFDGLLIENTNDSRNKLNRTFISTAEFNARMQRAKEIKPTAANMNLLMNAWEWEIWVLESKGFTPTYFPNYEENCVIERIYGVKFKDIPDADLSSTAVSTQPAQIGETPVVVDAEDTNIVEV
nr:tail fiber protein [Autographiviridae sp.]